MAKSFLSATAKAISTGRTGQRAKNIAVGRALGNAGVWNALWGAGGAAAGAAAAGSGEHQQASERAPQRVEVVTSDTVPANGMQLTAEADRLVVAVAPQRERQPDRELSVKRNR